MNAVTALDAVTMNARAQAGNTEKKRPKTKVIIPCLISYANIWTPRSVNNSEPRYSVVCIFSKTDKATLALVNAAIDAAKDEGKLKKWGGKIPANLKLPLHDGDIDRPDDKIYAGCYYINAASSDSPQVVDRRKAPITDQTQVYSGCLCNVSVNFYSYNTNGSRGVTAGLGNIQLVRQGERLGGKASADDDFDSLDIEDFDEAFGGGNGTAPSAEPDFF